MIRKATAIALFAALCLARAAGAGEIFNKPTAQFLAKVDADTLSRLGVQYKGRMAILDTLARDMVDSVCGKANPEGFPPSVVFLEWYFNSGAYLDKPVLYVREKQMQKLMAGKLRGDDHKAFEKTHRFPPGLVISEQAALGLLLARRATPRQCRPAATQTPLLAALQDLSERIELRVPMERLNARMSAFLAQGVYRPLPVAADEPEWDSAGRLLALDVNLPGGGMPGSAEVVHRLFVTLMDAYHRADTKAADKAADKITEFQGMLQKMLTERLTATRPADDPAAPYVALRQEFLGLYEAWRQRDADRVNRHLAALAKALPDAAGESYPSPLVQTLERWYNTTRHGTWLWIGMAVATVLLILASAMPGRRVWRWGGLGVLSLCTLAMAGEFAMRWAISQRAWYLPPIMNQFEAIFGSVLLGALLALPLEWLYKKNYIALSAALYGAICLLVLFYMPEKFEAAIKAQQGILASPIMAIHVAVIIIGHALAGMTLFISLAYLIGAVIVGLAGDGPAPSTAPDLTAPTQGESPLAAIDRCNLIVAQLAGWTILAGTILGAYWADFAWARWWGWDRKETWALVTALIYIVAVHARFVTRPRLRGLVTALLCLAGCAAMAFNWFVVSSVLSGLHSYA